MLRRLRWLQLADQAAYHVMSRGHNRKTLVADRDDLQKFLHLVQRYRLRFGLRLGHYCLLSNHFYLLLQLDEPRRLSALMAGLLLA